MGSVTVLGSINTDYVAVTPRLPGRGETVADGRFFKAGGGKGANQAVAVSRLGAACVMVGAVGRDSEGDAAIEDLKSNGVDVAFVSRKDAHSGVALIFVEEQSGENEIVVAPGSNAEVRPDDVRAARDVLAASDVLLAQLEIPIESVLEGLRLAKELEIATLLNPAPAAAAETLEPLLGFVDYLSPNQTELNTLTGAAGPEEGAKQLLARGLKGVFVTLGAEGALLVTGGRTYRQKAFQVKPVDTVGAGDAFNGALAVGLSEGMSPGDLLRFAAAAGAVSVTKEGARPSQPRREEVEALLCGE